MGTGVALPVPMCGATHPLVSVVMPARNAEPFIGGAIHSVLAQSHSRLELLIVDDASTDATGEIAEAHARRDARVRVVHGRYGTPGAARNRGFEAAAGEFLALLDSDDEWAPAFLERQLDLLARVPGAMIVSGNAFFVGGPFDGRPIDTAAGVRALGFTDVLRDEAAVCIMTVFRREVVERVGMFDPALMRSEDYELWLRATHAGLMILKNPEPLGFYRRRPDSLSSDEEAMLVGMLHVCRKVSGWSLGTEDRALLERQIAQLESRRLTVAGKRALASRDFQAAQTLLAEAGRHGAWKSALAAVAIRYWPEPVYQLVSRREPRNLEPRT